MDIGEKGEESEIEEDGEEGITSVEYEVAGEVIEEARLDASANFA